MLEEDGFAFARGERLKQLPALSVQRVDDEPPNVSIPTRVAVVHVDDRHADFASDRYRTPHVRRSFAKGVEQAVAVLMDEVVEDVHDNENVTSFEAVDQVYRLTRQLRSTACFHRVKMTPSQPARCRG